MKRKILFAAVALALVLAALIGAPALLRASGSAIESQPAQEGAAAAATRGFLGVGLRDLTPELQVHFGAPEGSGVLVASVEDGGPAAAAGLEVGDVIAAVDGLAVGSARALGREIRHQPGASVTLEVYRDGRARRLTATLGERAAHSWTRTGRTPEEWAELGERWERWAEEFGERWGEEFGEKFGERWGEEHAETWRRWAEEMAARGEGWEEMGQEIGKAVAQALSEVDWDQIGRSVEQSMKALEEIDWEGLGEDIEQRMQELERRLEERHEPAAGEE